MYLPFVAGNGDDDRDEDEDSDSNIEVIFDKNMLYGSDISPESSSTKRRRSSPSSKDERGLSAAALKSAFKADRANAKSVARETARSVGGRSSESGEWRDEGGTPTRRMKKLFSVKREKEQRQLSMPKSMPMKKQEFAEPQGVKKARTIEKVGQLFCRIVWLSSSHAISIL